MNKIIVCFYFKLYSKIFKLNFYLSFQIYILYSLTFVSSLNWLHSSSHFMSNLELLSLQILFLYCFKLRVLVFFCLRFYLIHFFSVPLLNNGYVGFCQTGCKLDDLGDHVKYLATPSLLYCSSAVRLFFIIRSTGTVVVNLRVGIKWSVCLILVITERQAGASVWRRQWVHKTCDVRL